MVSAELDIVHEAVAAVPAKGSSQKELELFMRQWASISRSHAEPSRLKRLWARIRGKKLVVTYEPTPHEVIEKQLREENIAKMQKLLA